ncbi:MAG TPA: mercury methylation corrinoid protein HgcA [Methanospirillum sp.]|nr:mercury methylation corrinoid protein HgcA [Methanospirillum sp.]
MTMEPCSCTCTEPTPDAGSSCCQTGENRLPVSEVMNTTSTLTISDHGDHLIARLGLMRMNHLVTPGLYRLGSPDADSPVFVSANYTLSFDALRSALTGCDAWILVIDTKGVNVWCAAGKGTFGTSEIVNRIALTRLETMVSHRHLIVPQLGAPGVSAREVLRQSGFSVEFGPVQARDLPKYLKTHQATQEMRTVTFPLRDRITLIPVELMQVIKIAIVAIILAAFLISVDLAWRILLSILAGTVLFPILLPWIPVKDFTIKGYLLGLVVFLPTTALTVITNQGDLLIRIMMAAGELLIFPAVVAYLALNFTGATPFTSRTGVKTEIRRYIRPLVGSFAGGIILAMLSGVARLVIVS